MEFPRSTPTLRLAAPALILLLGVFLLHCSASEPPATRPVHLADYPSEEIENLVVFVPGIMGSKLRDRETGQVIWGSGMSVIRPHDGGDNIALPITGADGAEDDLEAFQIVDEVRLGKIRRVIIYRAVVDALVDHGYQHGDFDEPQEGDNLFLFHYDWRRSNVFSAALLKERLETLRQRLGRDRLQVDLICQSNGAHVCRYFAKYGGASLDDAEAGLAGPPRNIDVERIILIGTANGGSLRTLRELNRGRRYVRLIGRTWQPEVIFTLRSLYEDLPTYSRDLFLDERGVPVDVDLFNPATWQRYGWSIFGVEATRRLERRPRPELYGDAATRLEFLRRMLERSKRFQALLGMDVEGFGDTRYYLVQNVYKPTSRRAVLLPDDDRSGAGWQTLFTGDPELEKLSYLNALASAPGDGHATLESQLHLSPQELGALAAPAFNIDGTHFDIILDPGTRRRLLELLQE